MKKDNIGHGAKELRRKTQIGLYLSKQPLDQQRRYRAVPLLILHGYRRMEDDNTGSSRQESP